MSAPLLRDRRAETPLAMHYSGNEIGGFRSGRASARPESTGRRFGVDEIPKECFTNTAAPRFLLFFPAVFADRRPSNRFQTAAFF